MNNSKSNKKTRNIIYNKYNGRCAYCGCKLDFENFSIDHIIPKWRKNDDDFLSYLNIERGKCKIENYNPSCNSCNS